MCQVSDNILCMPPLLLLRLLSLLDDNYMQRSVCMKCIMGMGKKERKIERKNGKAIAGAGQESQGTGRTQGDTDRCKIEFETGSAVPHNNNTQ